ncbi:uncharacterized protein LAESUDRAFT_440273 [Laetiporus sulphureus 93-53]|uniref:Uncharacterized protein n=1 Tax=Laetiporus sulphureus 93-53 TaxID=1314785 RepID=A0A165C248_9APHY|nr:uncharacterized protein LAESUDRAFT_440273 [Laetiporus sulphureus 93-53]KZT02062.1 hypothetical protein LAESUDRAFT_440273 [Laetiporus sulphureus 93-53]
MFRLSVHSANRVPHTHGSTEGMKMFMHSYAVEGMSCSERYHWRPCAFHSFAGFSVRTVSNTMDGVDICSTVLAGSTYVPYYYMMNRLCDKRKFMAFEGTMHDPWWTTDEMESYEYGAVNRVRCKCEEKDHANTESMMRVQRWFVGTVARVDIDNLLELALPTCGTGRKC